MNFKQWLKDKINNSSNVRQKAQELINNYNKDFKIGFGVVKQHEELAALLYAAQNNFPPNTKHNAILNTHNLPELYTPNTTQHEMWKMVRDLKIPIVQLDNGRKSTDTYVVGKDAHLLNQIIKTMHDKDDKLNQDSEENLEMLNYYRKQIGKLLGYTDKSIQAFIDRSNNITKKLPVPDVHDKDFINSVRENYLRMPLHQKRFTMKTFDQWLTLKEAVDESKQKRDAMKQFARSVSWPQGFPAADYVSKLGNEPGTKELTEFLQFMKTPQQSPRGPMKPGDFLNDLLDPSNFKLLQDINNFKFAMNAGYNGMLKFQKFVDTVARKDVKQSASGFLAQMLNDYKTLLKALK